MDALGMGKELLLEVRRITPRLHGQIVHEHLIEHQTRSSGVKRRWRIILRDAHGVESTVDNSRGYRAVTSIVALIPARAGSKRIVGKNTRLLAGHPLIAYTIAAAHEAAIFGDIYVCTDSEEIIDLASEHHTPAWRREPSTDDEPDIAWVERVVRGLGGIDAFAILRPTSPFRTAETIKRAYATWTDWHDAWRPVYADSLRAIEPVQQHPGKMWLLDGSHTYLTPLVLQPTGQPWHSSPTQTLPKVYVQNASLEIAWTETVRRTGTIAGARILAFETQDFEGLDLNTERDWQYAEHLIATGQATLPSI